MAADEDVSTPFTLIRDASVDASVVGRFLFFTTKDIPPTGVKLLEASIVAKRREAVESDLVGDEYPIHDRRPEHSARGRNRRERE